MKEFLELVWDALNTPVGITAMAGLLLWALNRLYAAKGSRKNNFRQPVVPGPRPDHKI